MHICLINIYVRKINFPFRQKKENQSSPHTHTRIYIVLSYASVFIDII